MSTPVRLGLLGVGRWGRNYIRTISDLPGVVLARVASRNPQTRSLVSPDTALDSDWRQVATAADIDGVIVATPPALHAAMAAEAIRAGKPVLIEKPLTLSLGEARDLLSESTAANGLVMVNHIHLFHPAYRQLKRRAVESGPIRFVRAAAGRWGPFRQDTPVLWDWGTHDVAMYLDLTGMPASAISVSLATRRRTDNVAGESISIRLAASDGPGAEIDISNLRRDKIRLLTVELDAINLVYDGLDQGRLYQTSRKDGERGEIPTPFPPTKPLHVVVGEFADAIRRGVKDRSGLHLGVETVAVLTQCQKVLA